MENLEKNEVILKITNLNKSFDKHKRSGTKKALDDLTFKVYKRQFYGFLGVNGAGKTTTLNIIMGLLSKDSGSIELFGEEVKGDFTRIRNNIGIVFQNSILDKNLSVYENLYSRLSLYKNEFKDKTTKQVVDEMVVNFKLEDIIWKKYGSLSGGQRRRVDIARALAHNPSILFLDEPTTGLDPISRRMVWDILEKLRIERGLTIILTTHYMDEADGCDYTIVIKKGKKLAEGTPAELKTRYAKSWVLVQDKPDHSIRKLIETKSLTYEIKGGYLRVAFDTYDQAHKFTQEHIGVLENFELIKGNMEDVFINLTNEENKKHPEETESTKHRSWWKLGGTK